MPDTEAVFDEIARRGRADAEVPLADLARWADPLTPFDQIAELIEAGRVEAWDRDDGPVLVLTPLSAERLNLKLLPDSSRWVDRRAKVRPPKRNGKARTTAETDLDDETETPLDQRPDPLSRTALDNDAMYERMAEIRPVLISKQRRTTFDIEFPPELILMGARPYPHPGQDRGPWAPQAIPTEFEVERGRDGLVKYQGETPGLCAACRKSVIPDRAVCEPCGRLWNEERYPRGVLEAAREEVQKAWAAWERRKGELAEVNRRAVEEIKARPDGGGMGKERRAS